jgi:hypothetical protein
LVFEGLHAGLQLSDELNQPVDQGDDRFFALLVNRLNLFTRG